jgi:hypothetical protein
MFRPPAVVKYLLFLNWDYKLLRLEVMLGGCLCLILSHGSNLPNSISETVKELELHSKEREEPSRQTTLLCCLLKWLLTPPTPHPTLAKICDASTCLTGLRKYKRETWEVAIKAVFAVVEIRVEPILTPKKRIIFYIAIVAPCIWKKSCCKVYKHVLFFRTCIAYWKYCIHEERNILHKLEGLEFKSTNVSYVLCKGGRHFLCCLLTELLQVC